MSIRQRESSTMLMNERLPGICIAYDHGQRAYAIE